ncbi:amino acid adenylation domain-containing protein [Polymorphospora rubra]|uniref:non-ribosomal peptide synthetase n=1 Tax=Polymorphospora rubra TaxID=338584 RepID=UPI0033EDD108
MNAEITDPARNDADARREALIRQRLAGGRGGRRDTIPHVDRGGRLPVSFGQQRLWFLTMLDPRSPEYLVPLVLRVTGDLDVAALGEAWRRLLVRHEVLRTRYQLADAEPIQVVDPAPDSAAIRFTDLTGLPAADRDRRALDLATADAAEPIDIGLEHPVRVHAIRLAPDRHLLAVVFHHIACDGWSMGVFINDLFTLYLHAIDAPDAPALPEPTVQYADFAAWQRGRLAGAELDRQLGHWRDRLTGLTPLELPTDRPRPAKRDWAGDRVLFTVPADLAGRLRDLGRRHDATLFTVGATAFQVLLSRYSGQRDISVGSAVAGRGRPEVRNLIGFFLNTVVLRATWSGDPSFADLLRDNRRTVLDALEHQEAPVQFLVDDVDRKRDRSRTPLFQVMFDLAEAAPSAFTMPGLDVEAVDLVGAVAKHDLRLELSEQGDGALRGVLEYPTALFDRATVERFAGHLLTLFDSVCTAPELTLSALEILDPAERELLLGAGPAPATRPAPRPVTAAVAEHARHRPHETAVVAGPDRTTYAQLHERANRIAHHLRGRGVGPGSVVGVCLGRGPDLLPTLLGVWRAGAAYVPVDPGDPAERVGYVLRDAGAALVVTQTAYAGITATHSGAVLLVDADRAAIDAEPATDPAGEPDPDAVAYLIYTSGSTGRPKGVLVSHRGLANYLTWAADAYLTAAGRGAPLFSSTAFDLVVTTLYLPLLAGQPVHLLPADLAVGDLGRALTEAAADGPFSFVKLTPGHLDVLTHQLTADQAARLAGHLVVGGEGFASRLADRWWDLAAGGKTRIVNEYGPTENTVANVAYFADGPPADPSAAAELLPIGRSMPGTTAYCLDAELRPQPVGVVGDLYLGGGQLAHGYRNLPAVTAERFVPDPYGPPGARLYRTGDRARVLAGGDIEFLGRVDDQIKVRGYRVETGEIVAALRRHPGVRDAVVTLRGTGSAGRTLVGYVVTTNPDALPIADLRELLAATLPDYMVPTHLVPLTELPLTSNGKTDLAALPDPDRAATSTDSALVAPRTAVEEQVAAVLRTVLGITEVGVDDDFFDLGGDSLSAVALVGDLRDAGLDIAVDDVFAHPTVAKLAELAAERPAVAGARTGVAPFALISDADRQKLPADVEDAFPVSMLQAGMVFEMMGGGEVNYYHNATTYQIRDDAEFSVPAFEAAVRLLVERQEVLRTGFDLIGYSQPLQLIHRTAHLPTSAADLRHLSVAEQDEQIRQRMAAERADLFDLATPALLRLHAVVRTDTDWALIITECHPIMEGWSYHMLLMELLTYYRQIRDGQPPQPAQELGIRFADFIAAEQESLRSEDDRGYWRRTVEGAARLALPPGWATGDGPRGPLRVEVMFADLEDGLRALAKTAEVPIKAVLHAAHLKVMSMLTDEPRFFGGLVCDTRPEVAGADRLYGLFLNTVPFPFELTAPTWRQLVRDVFAQEIELWPHRRYPMPAMQRELSANRRLVDVMFNYLDFRTVDMDLVDFAASIDDSQIEFKLSTTVFRQGLINLRMHPDAVSRPAGERLAAMYRQVLTEMAADPDGDALATYLPADERRRLVTEWNDTAVPRPATDLATLFEQQVAADPAATAAVLADGSTLSYAELDARANQLAHHLRGLGVGPEQFVGICAEPGPEMLVAVLGVVKADAAYLPLDPSHPTERLAYVLRDAGVSVLLTQERLADDLPPFMGQVVNVDTDWPEIAGADASTPARSAGPDSLVYAIYTSGSTGRPKGVMITHGGLANYLTWAVGAYTGPDGTGAPMLGSIAFDLAVTNLLVPLVAGRPVTLLPPGGEVEAVAGMLAGGGRFDLVKLTPGHLDVLRGLLPADTTVDAVGTFVVGGEQLPLETVLAWQELAPATRIVNEYGPTETVVGCVVHDVPADVDRTQPVAIGRPIDNTRLYVLDRHLQPVPVGATGELFIGGAGVARGYHGRPELTAERFVPDPYAPQPGGRLYRTGDLARYRADGNLEFLGRVDDQIKIRGYRIEPGEIEARLLAHPSVDEAVVVAHTGADGDRRLVAYAAGTGAQPSGAVLRDFLRETLPDYLVPATFVLLDALPRSAAGKIDRKALPSPDGARADLGTEFVAPRTATERRLCEIWERVLGVERIGIHDDLLDLGADSLSGLRVVAAATDLGLTMSPMDAIAFPTIAQLARHLLGGGTEELDRILRADSELDPAIRPAGPPADPAGPLLLTGATGFVGAFLLRELLDRTTNRVVCLVRGTSDEHARERLVAALHRWSAYHPQVESRVDVVAGDLGAPHLGLSADRFAELAGTVGAIYHNGADVNAVHPYQAMRRTNVDGTREIIRLACTGPTTPLHHVSTMSIFKVDAFDRWIDESSIQAEPPSSMSNGYGQSKWVAENLVREVSRRGLPTTIHRMAKVSWDTVTGTSNSADQFNRLIAAAVEVGAAPDFDYSMTLTPVDRVAAGIVDIAARPDAVGGCYHLISPHQVTWRQMRGWLATAGHPLAETDYAKWREALVDRSRQPGGERLNPLLMLLPRERDNFEVDALDDDYVPPTPTWWARHGGEIPPIHQEDFTRFLTHLRASS